MNSTVQLILVIASIYILFALLLALGCKKRRIVSLSVKRISLIIPARSEELDLPRVLRSIEGLDYPPELLEVILIDHQSTDRTLKLLREFAEKSRLQVKVISVIEGENCKAAALRAGIAAASGDYFAFTDAETSFESDWLKNMAESAGENTLTGGAVIIEGDSFFSRMQNLDWAHFIAAGAGFAGWGIPQSVFGKNMIIGRKLYESAGGFPEGMVWTEDLELAGRCKKSGKISLFSDKGCAVYSLPEKTLRAFIRQKIRWLKGTSKVDLWGLAVMITALLMDLTILVSAFISIPVFFLSWSLKSTGDWIILNGILTKLGRRGDIWLIPFYSIFAAVYRIILLTMYPIAQNPRWRQ